jgi:hypothetical protein
VDDPGPLRLAARDVAEQSVDERPVTPASGRVNHDACRLVDDEEVLVFVGDPERDVLSRERGLRSRSAELDGLAAREPVALGARAAVDEDVAGLEESGRRRA